jgi:putative CocE/NonD family hydrolase
MKRLSRSAPATLVAALIVGQPWITLAKEEVVSVPMRGGVTIDTYVRTPSGHGPWPAVLKKGYGITKGGADVFTGAGYVFVSQGVRGGTDPHGISGDARFFADDVDGYDTIEWIARQPWCNGNVAMFGPSYWGATQWLAAACGDPGTPPHLKAIIPSVINPDFWERSYRAHGAMNLSMTTISRAFEKKQATYDAFLYLPLIEMDRAIGGRENVLWNEYVSHWTYDKYWAYIGMRDKYRRIKIPVYIYAGWWDYYSGASLEYYNRLQEQGHTPEIRVWVDNAGHKQMPLSESIRWLDWVISRRDTGIKDEPPVRIFVQGIDQQRHYDCWPPRRMRYAKYYLHSPNGSRLGTLDAKPPGDEAPTRYAYDPRDPVPSIGGNANHRGINQTLKSGAVLKEGSFDQRPVETREDVLVFSTRSLEEDVEVIGPVSLKLHAATDAPDTDFTAVLIDVLPDGRAMNVTEGIVRARFRESIWEAPRLLEPGKDYEYTLELLPTARVFRKGHKIRLHLSSSRFPLWDRNTNTGNNPATDTQTKVASQIVYHDAARPSHLVLPVVATSAN